MTVLHHSIVQDELPTTTAWAKLRTASTHLCSGLVLPVNAVCMGHLHLCYAHHLDVFVDADYQAKRSLQCHPDHLLRCSGGDESQQQLLSSSEALISQGARQALAAATVMTSAEVTAMRSTLQVLASHLTALQSGKQPPSNRGISTCLHRNTACAERLDHASVACVACVLHQQTEWFPLLCLLSPAFLLLQQCTRACAPASASYFAW